MDVKMILSFLIANKKKVNGKFKMHVNPRKFIDCPCSNCGAIRRNGPNLHFGNE